MTRQCPNLGRYEIVSLVRPTNADSVENVLAVDGEQHVANAAEMHDVRVPSTPFPSQCHHGSVRRLDIGCRTPDRMEFATSCSDEALSGKDLYCVVSAILFQNVVLRAWTFYFKIEVFFFFYLTLSNLVVTCVRLENKIRVLLYLCAFFLVFVFLKWPSILSGQFQWFLNLASPFFIQTCCTCRILFVWNLIV